MIGPGLSVIVDGLLFTPEDTLTIDGSHNIHPIATSSINVQDDFGLFLSGTLVVDLEDLNLGKLDHRASIGLS